MMVAKAVPAKSNITGLVDSNPVLFLDIDGVFADLYCTRLKNPSVVPSELMVRPEQRGDVIYLPQWMQLKRLLKAYKVNVIIVSSWLQPYLLDDDEDVIALSKFLKYPLLGSLNTTGNRAESIKDFVLEHNITNWVVLDDSDVMYKDKMFFNKKRLVSPWGRYGLTHEHLERLRLVFDDEYYQSSKDWFDEYVYTLK